MSTATVNFGTSHTGLTLAQCTLAVRSRSGAVVSTVGATLVEQIAGFYALDVPLDTVAGSVFYIYKTGFQATVFDGGPMIGAVANIAVPTSPYLCARSAVKAALQIASGNTDLDTAVDSAIFAASDWIERYCRQVFALTTYTVYFSPGADPNVLKRGKALKFDLPPLVSVTSLHEDPDRDFAVDSLVDPADYYIENRQVVLYDDGNTVSFANGQRTVKAVVQAGYATIPALMQEAAAWLAVWLYRGRERDATLSSESVGGGTTSYKDEDMPKVVKAMLASGGFVRQG